MASSASSFLNLSPAKKAAGSFVNKNILKAKGDANRFLKLLKLEFNG